MTIDLSLIPVPQLQELLQTIPAEITRREVQEKNEVLNELRNIAKSRGYAIEDLLGKEVPKAAATSGKVKPKYRHPENATLEWTGRGKKPKWVQAWLDANGTIDQLLI